MIVGAKRVICTCGKDMEQTGGLFGENCSETYYCHECKKFVNVITPSETYQREFRLKQEVSNGK